MLHSCINRAETQPTNKQWLQNLACRLPCWQNITPQGTKFEDVVSILQSASITVHSVDEDEISFVFNESISGSVHKAPNGRVDPIILDVHNELVNVGDLTEVIGDPEDVSLTRELYTSECQAHLLYRDSGIILDVAYLKNHSKSKNQLDCQVELTSETNIFRMILIGGNLDSSDFWRNSSYPGFNYVKWKGYGSYP
jgi:hypothetical protein